MIDVIRFLNSIGDVEYIQIDETTTKNSFRRVFETPKGADIKKKVKDILINFNEGIKKENRDKFYITSCQTFYKYSVNDIKVDLTIKYM